MKKLLLIAAIIIPINIMAQNVFSRIAGRIMNKTARTALTAKEDTKTNVPVKVNNADIAKASPITDIPETAVKTKAYYMGEDSVYWVGMCSRSLAPADFYIDGTTVYLPCVVFSSYNTRQLYFNPNRSLEIFASKM